MAVIKYRDENGNLVAVGAGNHTHSPSDIGAADRVHGHTEATQETPGFMSKDDKQALDQAVQNIQTLDESLDTLVGNTPVNELISSALAPINVALENKVQAIPGKQLSTEDYTTAEKNKLAGLQNYELPTAGKDQLGGVKTSSTVASSSGYTACPIISGIPYYKNTANTAGSTNTSNKIYLVGATSQSSNPQTYSHDTAYVGTDGCLYSDSTKVSVEGHNHNDVYYTYTEVDNKFSTFENVISEQMSASIQSVMQEIDASTTKYIKTEMTNHTAVMATTSDSGHMSKTDKAKLDGLATVATSGNYNDLSNKPTIPSYGNATQSAAGLMSAADKKKLDGMTYTIDVQRDPNYVPGSNVGDNVITIVLPS